MRSAGEMPLQFRPEHKRGRVVLFDEPLPSQWGERDPIARSQRVTDGCCRLDPIALEPVVQPRLNVRGPRLRWTRRTLLEGGKTQGERHDSRTVRVQVA